jgi:hypothetical protein
MLVFICHEYECEHKPFNSRSTQLSRTRYHSYFGLHPEQGGPYIETELEIETLQDVEHLRKQQEQCGGSVGTCEGELDTIPDDFEGYISLRIPYTYAIQVAQHNIPYETVVIMYQEDNWYRKPRVWYNKPSKWWVGYSHYLQPYVLPYLKTRKYLKVNDPFLKVTLSASKKGASLTIDDVLFATRALMCDDTRTVDGDGSLKIQHRLAHFLSFNTI